MVPYINNNRVLHKCMVLILTTDRVLHKGVWSLILTTDRVLHKYGPLY